MSNGNSNSDGDVRLRGLEQHRRQFAPIKGDLEAWGFFWGVEPIRMGVRTFTSQALELAPPLGCAFDRNGNFIRPARHLRE